MNAIPAAEQSRRGGMTWTRALAMAEVFMGAAWVWNPARWGTHDGYVDHFSLLNLWEPLARAQAVQRQSISRAVRMGLGGEAGETLQREDARLLSEEG